MCTVFLYGGLYGVNTPNPLVQLNVTTCIVNNDICVGREPGVEGSCVKSKPPLNPFCLLTPLRNRPQNHFTAALTLSCHAYHTVPTTVTVEVSAHNDFVSSQSIAKQLNTVGYLII